MTALCGLAQIGVLNDALAPYVGKTESLRWALVGVTAASPWAIYHYWRGGVILKRWQDLARNKVTAAG